MHAARVSNTTYNMMFAYAFERACIFTAVWVQACSCFGFWQLHCAALRYNLTMAEPAPFSVTQETVFKITGGYNQNCPWYLSDYQLINGAPYTLLSKQNRQLAKTLGMNMSHTTPFKDHHLFAHLISQRDALVDKVLREVHAGDDPMADACVAESEQHSTENRRKRFIDLSSQSKMPHTVTLQLAEFVTESGLRVPAHTMNVVTTPLLKQCITMAATSGNFDWLALAIHAKCWSPSSKRKYNEDAHGKLPELDWPFTYFYTCAGALHLQVRFNDQNGLRKQFRRALRPWNRNAPLQNETTVKNMVSSTCDQIEKVGGNFGDEEAVEG